ncbi:Importin-11 [Willisornis vidua]|uniref:Importin-11 n=1 Tax=Willisornis vidua TaxID=1566151 RepID=A0ABQ9D0I3_9PASS|nr:Importin-11 [Willisornis vidua]
MLRSKGAAKVTKSAKAYKSSLESYSRHGEVLCSLLMGSGLASGVSFLALAPWIFMDLNSASAVVLRVLTQATSQDTALLKPAEEQLKQWETQPGFYSVLLNIFTNHSLDVNVRWLAVLYFKNGIDRYWRRVAPHALSEEEKTTLRAGLITNFNEPVNQIATQISVLIAKVARVDCPRQWPELIPTLVESVKVQDDLQQHRALLTFYHVTKTLSSKRLAADRKLFYDLTTSIYSFACSLWNHHTDSFLQQIYAGNEGAAANSLERTLLSLKGRNIRPENICRDRLEKTIILFTKVLLDFLDQHPFSFTALIQRSLEFSVSYVFTEAGEGIVFEQFIVQCMNIIKMIVKNYAYKPSKNVEAVEETGGDSWKYSLRPCAEVLFMDIFHEYNQTLTPVLLEMVHNLQGPTNIEDTNAILIKDAVYNAVGLTAYELFDSVDFDQWFKNQLLAELQVSHDRYKPIRRRVIWLIGQWISVKFKSDLRPVLYEAIRNLLQDRDLVYLESMFTLLFQLLQEVTQCDTKMHVLHVLSYVIERVNMQIRPYVGCLVQYLPLLWKQSEEHNMLRCAILTTLIHLVQGLGADSKNLYPFLLPVIQLSTDVSQPPHVYLLEDGLELWLVTLENSPCLTPELLRIFDNMSALLELSSENLKNCFKIINAYVFLSSSEFLQVVENVLKVNPVLGPQMFQPLLPSVFRGIIDGELDQILGNMIEMWVDRMDNITQPERRKLSALALLSLLPSLNSNRVQQQDSGGNNLTLVPSDAIGKLKNLERLSLSHNPIGSIQPFAFKGLNKLSIIQDKFCGIINISVEGLHDVMTEDSETGTYKDCMLMSHFEEPKATDDEEPPTEQDKRKKMLALKDPVHTVSLQQFIYEKLKAQQELLGEQGFQALMETVDTEIVAQLQEFLQGF